MVLPGVLPGTCQGCAAAAHVMGTHPTGADSPLLLGPGVGAGVGVAAGKQALSGSNKQSPAVQLMGSESISMLALSSLSGTGTQCGAASKIYVCPNALFLCLKTSAFACAN